MERYYLHLDNNRVVGLTSVTDENISHTTQGSIHVEVESTVYNRVLESMSTHLYYYILSGTSIVEVPSEREQYRYFNAQLLERVDAHIAEVRPDTVTLGGISILLEDSQLERRLCIAKSLNRGTIALSSTTGSMNSIPIPIHVDSVDILLNDILDDADTHVLYTCMVYQELHNAKTIKSKVLVLEKLGIDIGDIYDSRCEQVIGTIL